MKKYKNIIIAVVAVLVLGVAADIGTNALFKSGLSSECAENMGAEMDCKCMARVVSSRISFIGKWKLMLFSDIAPVEVMKDVPFMELAMCAMM